MTHTHKTENYGEKKSAFPTVKTYSTVVLCSCALCVENTMPKYYYVLRHHTHSLHCTHRVTSTQIV